ncbi:MAG: hypothetical protein QM811_28215 [Pirellulales bacterium]
MPSTAAGADVVSASPRLRVVKFGGSLFARPAWHDDLRAWFAQQLACPTLLVVGGGGLADALRCEAARFPYDERLMHDLALQAMDMNATCVRARLPEIGSTCVDAFPNRRADSDRLAGAGAHDSTQVVTPHIASWWSQAERQNKDRPPATWQTTSDTLAAWLAVESAADELVLLKSCLPQACGARPDDPADWAARGYVDPEFPNWIRHVRSVRCEVLPKCSKAE